MQGIHGPLKVAENNRARIQGDLYIQTDSNDQPTRHCSDGQPMQPNFISQDPSLMEKERLERQTETVYINKQISHSQSVTEWCCAQPFSIYLFSLRFSCRSDSWVSVDWLNFWQSATFRQVKEKALVYIWRCWWKGLQQTGVSHNVMSHDRFPHIQHPKKIFLVKVMFLQRPPECWPSSTISADLNSLFINLTGEYRTWANAHITRLAALQEIIL